jgi:hypothetical protein
MLGDVARRLNHMPILKSVAKTIYIILSVLAAGYSIDSASEGRILIPFALPFAVMLVLTVRFLGAKTELAGWAVFTAWLGLTYLQTGGRIEIATFIIYVLLAFLGAFKSPHFLAAAWVLHPLWDFVPRELPALLKDLPTACIMFDLPIGLYIFWQTRTKRLQPFASKPLDAAPILNR